MQPTHSKLVGVILIFTSVTAICVAGPTSQPSKSIVSKALYGTGSGGINQSPVPRSDDNSQLEGALRGLKAQTDTLRWMTGEQKQALRALIGQVGGSVEIRVRPETGTPSFLDLPQIAGEARMAVAAPSDPQATAYSFLNSCRALLRLEDPAQELKLITQHTDELGLTHLRFTQMYHGLDVWPAELFVHLDKQGRVDCLNGAFVTTPRDAEGSASISAEEAMNRARQIVPGGMSGRPGTPMLIFYARLDQAVKLAWRLDLNLDARTRWLVVVDARSGDKLAAFNQVTEENVLGQGVDLLNQNRALNVWHGNNKYYLVDSSKPMFDPNSTPPGNAKGAIMVVDANHQTLPENGSMSCAQITSTSPNAGWLKDGVSAAFGVSQTYDYFRAQHNRNSIDGQGGTISAIVRYGQNYANAFWNGQALFFGDGKPYAAALDIVAHEMAHGVTSFSANLIYQDQSGAMNEAFSDIFGEAVEVRAYGGADWAHGEDLGNASRSLSNPSSIEFTPGHAYPSKMSEFIGPNDPVLSMFQNKDNGGVHINGTIISHAFYLLSAGMPGALALTNSTSIFYRALTTHLVAQSQFLDCRLACVKSAQELYGENSEQALKTAQAFDAVELFDAVTPTNTPPNPTVTNADSVLLVYYDRDLGDYYLARREDALQDPPYGTSISGWAVKPRRPSVSGDGSYAAFVNSINDMCLIPTDGSAAEQSLGFAGQINSVAMAPDGQHYGFVLLGWDGFPENKIRYFDLTGPGTSKTITLTAPTDAGHVSSIAYADTMCFTPDNRYLVYDALNTLQISDGTTQEAWSIYAYDLATDRILTVVAPVPNLDVGNPSVGHLANDLITFEVTDKTTGVSSITASNLRLGTRQVIGSVSGMLAWPCYNGDDSAIAYTQVDGQNQTGSSIMRQSLGADHLTPVGAVEEWVDDGAYSFVYRRGTYTAPAAQKSVDLAVTVTVTPNPVPVGSNATIIVTLRNNGPDDGTDVTVVNTLPSNTRFLSGTMSQGTGSHSNGKVTCLLGNLDKNATATATIVAQALSQGEGVNGVTALSDQNDPAPANNSTSASLSVGTGGTNAVITVLANPAEGGTVTGGGTFPVGGQTQIAATANEGWTFNWWQDGSTQNPRTITVPTGGATYTAQFTTACDTVAITSPAVPAAGAVNHLCTLSPSSTITYVTNRVNLPDWVTKAVLHDSKGNNITMGSGVTVTLAGGAAYTIGFDVAAHTGGSARSADVMSVTYAGCAQTLTLTQSGTQATATLVVQASPAQGGTVTGGGTFTVGSQQQLAAIPSYGWLFGQWHDGSTQNPRTVTVVAGGSKYTAYFTNYTPQIVAQPQDLAVETGQNATFTVTAAAHSGVPYTFYWHKHGTMVSAQTAGITSDYTIPAAQPSDAGPYFVVVSNSSVGVAVTSRTASLLVTNAPPGPMVLFSNTAALVINDGAAATPYPSTITVAGQPETLKSATVTLSGLTHVWPQDLGVLLVGPQGQKVVLLANAGGGQAVSNVELTFDDAAAGALTEADAITSGIFRPSCCAGGDTFCAPAPSGPYASGLSVFKGTNPNGVWSLYVQDDQPGDSGTLSGGWTLALGVDKPLQPAGTPELSAPRLLSTRQFQFTLSGATGSNYEVRVSSDLTNWKLLRTLSLAGSATNVLDPSSNLVQRFYRAELRP